MEGIGSAAYPGSAGLAEEKPAFHLAPAGGWVNDPNGPLYFNGAYHMFFQHLPNSAIWGFKLVWGHACSKDLVHWELLPHAIEPSPGTVDGDGCFSGCAAVDQDGTPVLLYTGIRLRGDWRLTHWHKVNVPIIALPPPNVQLAGWRDPYLVGPPKGHPEDGWTMLIGSGIKGQGGTVLQYQSKDLTQGWQLVGELCSGLQEDGTGIVWECPLLLKLPLLASGNAIQTVPLPPIGSNPPLRTQPNAGTGTDMHRYFLCISPDACTNPTLYYLGDCVQIKGGHSSDPASSTTRSDGPAISSRVGATVNKFLLKEADGPHHLDLGDIMYAPNTLLDDKHGRVLLWGWMQEARKVAGEFTYAGCLSCPRELWLEEFDISDPQLGNLDFPGTAANIMENRGEDSITKQLRNTRLVQRPVAEISALRLQETAWLWPPAPHENIQDKHRTQHLADTATTKVDAGRAPDGKKVKVLPSPVQEEATSSTSFHVSGTQDVNQHQQLQPDIQQHLQHHQHHPTGIPYLALPIVDDTHTDPNMHQAASAPVILPPSLPLSPLPLDDPFEAHWRDAAGISDDHLCIGAGESLPIPHVLGPYLDLEVDLVLVLDTQHQGRTGSGHRLNTYNISDQQKEDVGGMGSGQSIAAAPEEEEGHTGGATYMPAAVPPGGMPQRLPADRTDGGKMGRTDGGQMGAGVETPAGACSGVLIRSWQIGVEGSAAVLFSWATGVLEVVFEALDPETHRFSLAAPGCRRVGGKLQRQPLPGQPLKLRLLLDFSLLEVFTGDGEVLSTRVYRGTAPPGAGSGVELVSVGCTTHVQRVAAYEMKSCWVTPVDDLSECPDTLLGMQAADLGMGIGVGQVPPVDMGGEGLVPFLQSLALGNGMPPMLGVTNVADDGDGGERLASDGQDVLPGVELGVPEAHTGTKRGGDADPDRPLKIDMGVGGGAQGVRLWDDGAATVSGVMMRPMGSRAVYDMDEVAGIAGVHLASDDRGQRWHHDEQQTMPVHQDDMEWQEEQLGGARWWEGAAGEPDWGHDWGAPSPQVALGIS